MAENESKPGPSHQPAVRMDEDNDDNVIVLLNVQTTGLHADCEILQIGAKCPGNEPFSVYINPVGDIPEIITKKFGWRICDGNLMLRGTQVPTVSMSEALIDLHKWLQSLKGNRYIAIHKLSFGGLRLHRAITNHSLRTEFSQVVQGFIDTLSVIRNVTGRRSKDECTLIGLAHFYNIPANRVDDAARGCEILHEILKKLQIKNAVLVENSKDFAQQVAHWDKLIRRREIVLTSKRL